MPLPSQSTRIPAFGRTYGMGRRRRRQARFVGWALGAAAVGLMVWLSLSWGGNDGTLEESAPSSTISTGTSTISTGSDAGPTPPTPSAASEPTPASESPPSTVVEIHQGRLGRSEVPAVPLASTMAREPETTVPPPPSPPEDPVATRARLSRLLASADTAESARTALRSELSRLNDDLIFSPRIAPGDPFVAAYVVQGGDGLERIARQTGAAGHWRLIQRVNQLAAPNRIRPGQTLKIVKGPFHVIVTKSAFRLDLYMGDPNRSSEWIYVRSFPVGLGESGSTPTGRFVVKRHSKLENPYWVNPRTGERFAQDDPRNPIGERWIGLEGVGDAAGISGYGIHGTIEPDSIGRERSMGCVRLLPQDVELVYDLLSEGVSVVEIRP